jgi:glycerol-3-phosphate dehydrogenase
MLLERGKKNGVPSLEIWDAEKLREQEPNLNKDALCALYAPTAAVVSPWEYALALAETAVLNGVRLFLNHEATAIARAEGCYHIQIRNGGGLECKTVVNAAGLYSDAVHNMTAEPSFKILPDKGEYYLMDKSEGETVSHVIFQCPTPTGKGTLISPTVHGNLIVGPNNEPPADKDDVSTSAAGLGQVSRAARKTVPDLNLRSAIRTFGGIRAASDSEDFIIAEAKGAPGFIDLAGIKSPGLTAAPAIAKMAAALLKKSGLELTEKENHIRTRKKIHFAGLNIAEKQKLISARPEYGRVICRCETVTEGEILDAIRSPVPPVSVEGVKRRCNAGMGRCQGGFCGPRVVELLSAELGVSPLAVPQDKAGSFILVSETKKGGCHG